MVARLSLFIAALLLTLSLSAMAHADTAQDVQVEEGVKAYDAGDYQRAKDILLPLAEAGHPKAMNMVGLMHYDTPVFPNDPVVECDWYEKAAHAGYPSGMYNMSICFDGNGRPLNSDASKAWLLKAADHGHISAMINLAALDTAKGSDYLKWHRMAVRHGNVFAKVSLWLDAYRGEIPKHERPKVTLREIACVSWNIIILDGEFEDCD